MLTHTSKFKLKFLLFVALVFVIGVNVATSTAAAYPTPPYYTYVDPLVINEATYLDLDADGLPDDVSTKFSFFSPTGRLCYFTADVDLYLELPSGATYHMSFSLAEIFVSLPIEAQWYNCATESGDYTFTVIADVWGYDSYGVIFYGLIGESLVFDPRDYKDGGLPFGIVIY